MLADPTPLNGLMVLTPVVHEDARGFLFESHSAASFAAATGRDSLFVQDNHTFSRRRVLRGLHFQSPRPQGKLVRALAGEIFAVAADLRRSSSTCGQWFGITLSAATKKQLWVPEGFAFGFLTLSETSEVLYKVTAPYLPQAQHTLRHDDAQLGINWPLTAAPILSDKDRIGQTFSDLELFE